jgi:hypothetical protein
MYPVATKCNNYTPCRLPLAASNTQYTASHGKSEIETYDELAWNSDLFDGSPMLYLVLAIALAQ